MKKRNRRGAFSIMDYALAGFHAAYDLQNQNDNNADHYALVKMRNIYEDLKAYNSWEDFEKAFWEEMRSDPEREWTA